MVQILILIIGLNLSSCSNITEDQEVLNKCKDRVFKNVHNGYDKISCKQMFSTYKKMENRIGAAKTYDYLDDIASEEGWKKDL